MSKFNKLLTTNGEDLIKERAKTRTEEVKECFNGEKIETEKAIRDLKSQITEMEDLAVRTTDQLVVGKDLKPSEWAKRRIDLELKSICFLNRETV